MRAEKLGDALQQSGFNQFEHQLTTVLANYFKSGGTDERLQQLIFTAKAMSGSGQQPHVGNVERSGYAAPRQPVEDGGAVCGVPDNGREIHASPSSSHRGGEGHSRLAQEGHIASALPVRDPTAGQRAVAGSIAKVLSVTVLDTFRIRDGRSIGDVRFGEIERLRSANAMEASVFRQIQRKFGFADSDTKLRDLITADDLNAMKQRAAEVADAQ